MSEAALQVEIELSHPVKTILKEYREHSKINILSFGCIGNAKAQKPDLHKIDLCPTVAYILILHTGYLLRHAYILICIR